MLREEEFNIKELDLHFIFFHMSFNAWVTVVEILYYRLEIDNRICQKYNKRLLQYSSNMALFNQNYHDLFANASLSKMSIWIWLGLCLTCVVKFKRWLMMLVIKQDVNFQSYVLRYTKTRLPPISELSWLEMYVICHLFPTSQNDTADLH